MLAEQYFVTKAHSTTPLLLMSKNQWQSKAKTLNKTEELFFYNQNFLGDKGQLCIIYAADGAIIKIYLGVGDDEIAEALALAAVKLPLTTIYELVGEIPFKAYLYWAMAQYQFNFYKKNQVQLRLLLVNELLLKTIIPELEAIFLVRDLINEPANQLGPEQIANHAKVIADKFGAKILEYVGRSLLENNYPAIFYVGNGSDRLPRLLQLNWGKKTDPRIAIVGKGVSFDTGGLDLKQSQHMRLMKKDMGGAAHALALAQWIMSNNLSVSMDLYLPLVENSIGPKAYRPGDVITMRNGLTVEIDNTDAEGRLILADALVKASEQKPELIIDFATLTGAARVALGTQIAALFSNDKQLIAELLNVAEEVQEAIWPLPLYAPYNKLIDSSIADLSNASASSYAGAITAALFLQRFVDKNISWVHFDIMAWNLNNQTPGKPEGGEAMALRTLFRYLAKRFLSN